MSFPTINPLLWRVIGSGLWRQCDVKHYTIVDLLDALEYLDVKEINERRYADSVKQRHERG